MAKVNLKLYNLGAVFSYNGQVFEKKPLHQAQFFIHEAIKIKKEMYDTVIIAYGSPDKSEEEFADLYAELDDKNSLTSLVPEMQKYLNDNLPGTLVQLDRFCKEDIYGTRHIHEKLIKQPLGYIAASIRRIAELHPTDNIIIDYYDDSKYSLHDMDIISSWGFPKNVNFRFYHVKDQEIRELLNMHGDKEIRRKNYRQPMQAIYEEIHTILPGKWKKKPSIEDLKNLEKFLQENGGWEDCLHQLYVESKKIDFNRFVKLFTACDDYFTNMRWVQPNEELQQHIDRRYLRTLGERFRFDPLPAIKAIANHPCWNNQGTKMLFWHKVPTGVGRVKTLAGIEDAATQSLNWTESKKGKFYSFLHVRKKMTSDYYGLIKWLNDATCSDGLRIAAINAFCKKWNLNECMVQENGAAKDLAKGKEAKNTL